MPHAESVVHFVKTNGERAMYESIELRKACCALRKLEPLSRMLAGQTAWVTGLRRSDGPSRAGAPVVASDAARNVTKINPIAAWTDDDGGD